MINQFWDNFCKVYQLTIKKPEPWMFGDGTKTMADELGKLVLEGKKTATCSALKLYKIKGEEIPKIGQYDIILDGNSTPIAITQIQQIEIIKMNEVTVDFAKKEGEGDLSYQYWYDAHLNFFTKEFSSLGLTFSPDQLLVCEEFKVIYRAK